VQTRTVLVTGAFGNLGQMVLKALGQRGYRVLAMDLGSRRNRRSAARAGGFDPVAWGDVRTIDFEPLIQDCVAVIHLAAVLPPVSENAPALAHDINVGGTLRLMEAIGRSASRPLLIYPSSVTVYGYPEPASRLMRPDDPAAPSDHYTRHKVEVEQRLAASEIPWVVLRLGVSVDSRTLGADLSMLRKLFRVAPDNPFEYVHPIDVATAMAHAIESPRALRRILLVGGGEACRVTQHRFLSAAFDALGIALPREMLGSERYYTPWMDTAESQEILQFQSHAFADYQEEMRQRLRRVRWLTAPLAPLVLAAMRRILGA
jgi:nucleoside-diphosphate-sugar epimerase